MQVQTYKNLKHQPPYKYFSSKIFKRFIFSADTLLWFVLLTSFGGLYTNDASCEYQIESSS